MAEAPWRQAAVPPPPPGPTGHIPSARIKSEISDRREPPPCVQNAMLTKDKKPFTYTPGGIDLSEIRSPRMARRLERNAMNEGVSSVPQTTTHHATGPLPPSALAAMQPQLSVQVFPTGGIPQPPQPPQGGPPPPPPPPKAPPMKTSPLPTDGYNRPDMTKIIPENPMALLRKTSGPIVKQDPILNKSNAQTESFNQSGYAPANAQPRRQVSVEAQNKPTVGVGSIYIQPINQNKAESPGRPTPPPYYKRQPSTPQQESPKPQVPESPNSPKPTLSKAPTPWLTQRRQLSQDVPEWAVNDQRVQSPPVEQQQQVESPQTKPVRPWQQQQQQEPQQPRYPQQQNEMEHRRQQADVPSRYQQEMQPRYQQPQEVVQQRYQPQQHEMQQRYQPQQQEMQQRYQPQQQEMQPRYQPQQQEMQPRYQPQQQEMQPRYQPQQQEMQPRYQPQQQYQPQEVQQRYQPQQQEMQPRYQQQPQQYRQEPAGGVHKQVQNREKPQVYYPPERTEVVIVNDPPQIYHHPGHRVAHQTNQQPKRDDGIRIIPVQIEGRSNGQVRSPNPGANSDARSFNRQLSWNTTPTQSNTFRVLQKITQTDGADDDDQTVIEHSPKTYQQFPQRQTSMDGRKWNQNDSDQALMGTFKQVPQGQPIHAPGPKVRTIPIQLEGNGPTKNYVPPSEQTVQEPKKYMGSSIPSRSFKMLQAMTAPDECGPGQSDL